MTMQDNIQQMLANEERLDQISENAENLNEQVSSAFPRYFRFARNLSAPAVSFVLKSRSL